MNKNEGSRAMLNIENIYEEVFTRKGMGLFMRMAWLHIKDECDEKEIKELLIGRKVKVDGDNLILDNGIILEVIANEGCGGCQSGWYSITKLNEVDNAITNVEFECDSIEANEENNYSDTSYKIFVFCEDTRINLLQVDGSEGNGYYGTGYEIIVKQKEEM